MGNKFPLNWLILYSLFRICSLYFFFFFCQPRASFAKEASVFEEAQRLPAQAMWSWWQQGRCTVLLDEVSSQHMDFIQPPTLRDTQSCSSLCPSPAEGRHFGKPKWKQTHNGHRVLKRCGNNIRWAKKGLLGPACVCSCVCARVYEWFMRQRNTKAESHFHLKAPSCSYHVWSHPCIKTQFDGQGK